MNEVAKFVIMVVKVVNFTLKEHLKPVLSRSLIIALLLVVQILALVLVVLRFSDRYLWYSGLSHFVAPSMPRPSAKPLM